eukprot:m51a1_g12827 hypothetical protein (212) ;mRNA; f:78-3385
MSESSEQEQLLSPAHEHSRSQVVAVAVAVACPGAAASVASSAPVASACALRAAAATAAGGAGVSGGAGGRVSPGVAMEEQDLSAKAATATASHSQQSSRGRATETLKAAAMHAVCGNDKVDDWREECDDGTAACVACRCAAGTTGVAGRCVVNADTTGCGGLGAGECGGKAECRWCGSRRKCMMKELAGTCEECSLFDMSREVGAPWSFDA